MYHAGGSYGAHAAADQHERLASFLQPLLVATSSHACCLELVT